MRPSGVTGIVGTSHPRRHHHRPRPVLLVSRLRRPIAAWFTLWMALYVGAPQLVHPCPEHSAVAAVASASHSATTTAEGEHGAGHGHHGAQLAHGPAQGDGSSTGCCCPGPQCGSSAALATVSPAWRVAITIRPQRSTPGGRTVVAPRRVAHALPFATAPPAALSA